MYVIYIQQYYIKKQDNSIEIILPLVMEYKIIHFLLQSIVANILLYLRRPCNVAYLIIISHVYRH